MPYVLEDIGLWRCFVHHRVGGVLFKTEHRRDRRYGSSEWCPASVWNALSTHQREEMIMGFFDRERKRNEGEGQGGQLVDEAFAKRHATLVEVMSARGVVEGHETNRMSLSLFVQDGQWKAILKDKQDGLCLWVSAQTIAALWTSLEACLVDPETVWRTDRYAGANSAKRVKRK